MTQADGPRTIVLHPAAPPQPQTGAPCNGCGVCCAAEPCPLGMVLSRRRSGACAALTWCPDGGTAAYRCGALAEPARWLPWLPAALAMALVRRWIAAGRACDCTLQRG